MADNEKKKLKYVPYIEIIKNVDYWGLKDNDGNVVLPCEYQNIKCFDEQELYFIQKNELWGVFDKDLKPLTQFEFRYAPVFNEGLTAVLKDHMFGYINTNCETVIPFIYKRAQNFNNGCARASKDGFNWGVIDKEGKTILPFEYEDFGYFYCGLVRALKRDSQLYGYYDRNYKEVIPCLFDRAEDFDRGIAVVYYRGRLRYIDKDQNEYTKESKEIYQKTYNRYKILIDKIIDEAKNDIIDLGDCDPYVRYDRVKTAQFAIRELVDNRNSELEGIEKKGTIQNI